MKTAKKDYHPLSVLLHWGAAFFVIASVISVEVGIRMSRTDPLRPTLLRFHMIAGHLVFALNLLRLALFSVFGTPTPDGSDFHQVHAARFMHAILYGSIGFLACSGTILYLGQATGSYVLGVYIPEILSPMGLSMLAELHHLVSTAFIVFCGLHAAAALCMHYFGRQATLTKMKPEAAVTGYITVPEPENYMRVDGVVVRTQRSSN